MTMRNFFHDWIEIEHDGVGCWATRICCAACGAKAYYPHRRGVARQPIEATISHFQQDGWVVGSGAGKDFCPQCARRGKGRTMDITVKKTKPETAVTAVAIQIDPPRAATFEERQIINMKLMEVYDSPTTGYLPGWTDSRVGKDLSYPRAWVTAIREAVFGPEGSNPDFERFLAEKAALETELCGVRDAIGAASARLSAAEKRLADLGLTGKRIEREIGR